MKDRLLLVTLMVTGLAGSWADSPHPITPNAAGAFSLTVPSSSPPVVGATTHFSWDNPPNVTLHDGWSRVTGDDGSSIECFHSASGSFLQIRSQMRASAGSAKPLSRVDLVRLPIDLGLPLERLRILGTGGLFPADQAPGSYMWIAVVDPATRRGFVCGFLTSERASGVLIPEVKEGKLTLTARLEFGRGEIPPNQSETTDLLAIGFFEDARLGLEAYATLVAQTQNIKLLPQPSGYCTWYHAGSSNAERIAELADFAAAKLKPFGLSVVQIDDGWQSGETKNGPRKDFSKQRAGGPYPEGMKKTADRIAATSMTPGLWYMPFAGTYNDPAFANRSHWFARRADGTPFDTSWGGTCLDVTHPDVQSYIKETAHRLTHDWGYRYLKMDGLWMGTAADIQYVNDAYKDDQLGSSVIHDPKVTNVQALRRGVRLIREGAGPDVFLLGCCAPQNMRSYGGAFGLVDAMRIGPDNGAATEHLVIGPRYGSRNYFLHGKVWWNDPDPVYVRRSLSLAQSELTPTWAAVTGQITIASDELPRLPADRLNILKRTMQPHGRQARPVDLFDRDVPRVWVVPGPASSPRTVVGLFNWDAEPISISESLTRLGLDPARTYAVFDFWPSKRLESVTQNLTCSLHPIGTPADLIQEKKGSAIKRCCASLSLVPIESHPQLISTSQGVAHGHVDILSEQWDQSSRSYSGTSRVVANDPYELRFLTHSHAGDWTLERVSVEPASAKVVSTSTDEPGLVRVRIEPTQSESIQWKAQFAAKK